MTEERVQIANMAAVIFGGYVAGDFNALNVREERDDAIDKAIISAYEIYRKASLIVSDPDNSPRKEDRLPQAQAAAEDPRFDEEPGL